MKTSIEKWKDHVRPDLEELESIAQKDFFKRWDRSRMPETIAGLLLGYALELAISGLGGHLSNTLMEKARDIIDRAIREDKLRTERSITRWPLNIGELLRVKSHLLLVGEGLVDVEAMRISAASYLEYIQRLEWDEMAEAWQLSAVQMLLLSGDTKQADVLLREKKFDYQQEQWQALMEIVSLANGGSKLHRAFDSFFEQIRHPTYKAKYFCEVALVRFEFALLRDKYIISPDQTISVARAIAAIANP